MSTSKTPPSEPTVPEHEAPSAPSSPLTKRPKTMAAPAPATDTTATKLEQSPPLLVKRLGPTAKLPTRGSAFAAGYDVYSAHDTSIPARGKALVDTEISIAVPAGTCMLQIPLLNLPIDLPNRASTEPSDADLPHRTADGRIAPRSGLASKNFIDTGAGVIDADYRGQVKVLLFNHGETDFQEVEEVEELEASVRGAGGFGSTG
ncbi:MAG: hypothetical protein M4579_005059 [Chaenotheca gracillima]|nr:MAG: hypothetical protein M4579_005059 [Chaenotheca gracillima]